VHGANPRPGELSTEELHRVVGELTRVSPPLESGLIEDLSHEELKKVVSFECPPPDREVLPVARDHDDVRTLVGSGAGR
jgi:hypothetical protein